MVLVKDSHEASVKLLAREAVSSEGSIREGVESASRLTNIIISRP